MNRTILSKEAYPKIIFLLIYIFILLLAFQPKASAASWIGRMGPIIAGSGVLTSDFGPRNTGIEGASTNHAGMDIAADAGTVVLAPCDGIIDEYTGMGSGYGGEVAISTYDDTYGNIWVICGHIDPSLAIDNIGIGNEVKQGTPIGMIVSSESPYAGTSSGCHVHFQVSQYGTFSAVTSFDPHTFCTEYGGPVELGYGAFSPPIKLLWDATYKFTEPAEKVIADLTKACINGLDLLKSSVIYIFFLLLGIDFVYGASIRVIDYDNLDSIFTWLLKKILLYAILVAILDNWASLVANFIKDFFVGMGGIAFNGATLDSAKDALSSPFNLVAKGANIIAPIMQEMGKYHGSVKNLATQYFTILFMLICVIAIFTMLTIISVQIILTYLEFYFTMISSFVMFMLSGTKQTRQYASKTFNGIFTISIKLMFFSFFALMLQAVMTDFTTDSLFQQKQVAVAAGGEQEVYDALKNLGFNDVQCAGIMGNMSRESSYNTMAVNDLNPAEPGTETMVGLIQAGYEAPGYTNPNGTRFNTFLEQYCNGDTTMAYTVTAQCTYFCTLENQYGWSKWSDLHTELSSSDPGQAARDFCWLVEGVYVSDAQSKGGGADLAEEIYSRMHNGIIEGAVGGDVVMRTITIMNFMLVLKLILIIAMFMVIGDKLSNTIVKTFGKNGFRFSNEQGAD